MPVKYLRISKSNLIIKIKFNNTPQKPLIKKLIELNLNPVLKLDKITTFIQLQKINTLNQEF